MSKSILSICSNRGMNFLLETLLGKDFNFFPVTDALQGIYQLKKEKKVDLIVVDIDCNTVQNWEFIEHIKTSRLYNTPLIILASKNDDYIGRKCYELEIDEIFFKPFNPIDLFVAIQNLVSSYSKLNQLS